MPEASKPEAPSEATQRAAAEPERPRRRREFLPGVTWAQWLAAGAVLLLILAALVLVRVTSCEPPAAARATSLERLP